LTIDDDVYRKTKELAARRGCSVSSVIEDCLREALADLTGTVETRPLPLLRETGGTLPGVDLDDRKALRELLDIGGNSSALP
jgi:hypothetical protein